MALASSVKVPYMAYLRVYEPLAAFPEPERSHWARYAKRAKTPTAQDEQRRALADLLPTPPVPVPVHESADAFIAVVNEVTCVCPWRTRLRGWQALESLDELLPSAQFWLHGHLHCAFDYVKGGCRVVANPLGYRSKGEQEGFRPQLLIEVPGR